MRLVMRLGEPLLEARQLVAEAHAVRLGKAEAGEFDVQLFLPRREW